MQLPSILKGKDMPKHLAVNATGIEAWAIKKNKELSIAEVENIKKINELIEIQLKNDIPILTLQVSTRTKEELAGILSFLNKISEDKRIEENKVRIYVIGDWYGSSVELTEIVKKLMEKTKDYDNYFLNILVNYDGQKEILTALKLLVKKSQSDKINHEDISLEIIKDNLASSYFIPPDLIIENGNSFSGTLLWDSKNASIYFTQKMWLDFEKSDFEKAINFYNKKDFK